MNTIINAGSSRHFTQGAFPKRRAAPQKCLGRSAHPLGRPIYSDQQNALRSLTAEQRD